MSEVREFPQKAFAAPAGACQILLVRHGASAPYREGEPHPEVDGHGDPPLDPIGVQQAGLVAKRLISTGEQIDAVYVTTLQRTAQTAAPLVDELAIEPIVEPLLREVHLGEWEGGEIRRRVADGDPIAKELAAHGRWDIIPGAEPADEFADRVRAGIEAIATQHRDQVVVAFVHGGVIGQVIALATGAPPLAFSGADNGSISHLVVTDEHWHLRCYNDTSHLSPTFTVAAEPLT